MFDSPEEVQQKLSGCILLYRNKPIYVLEAAGINEFRCYFLDDKTQSLFNLSCDDPELNYRNLGSYLGYINLEIYKGQKYNEATYMMRQPRRASSGTQGLSKNNVYVFGFKGSSKLETTETGSLPFNQYIWGADNISNFQAMLDGKYPTLKALRGDFTTRSDLVSRAFDKRWAVEVDNIGPFYLLYKNTRVGYTEDLERLVVSDRYRFLRRDLDEIKEKMGA